MALGSWHQHHIAAAALHWRITVRLHEGFDSNSESLDFIFVGIDRLLGDLREFEANGRVESITDAITRCDQTARCLQS